MSAFEADTAVTPVEGGYEATVDPRWNIGDNPNGGYLLAIGVRAMLAESCRPDPLTVTAHYLAPPAFGPVLARTQTVKAGRTFTTVMGEMVQDGRERVRLVGAFGELAAQRGPTRISASPPDLPPPADCVTLAELTRRAGRPVPENMHRYDLLLPPNSPWGSPKNGSDPFEIAGWIRFKDGTPPSTVSLVTFADAFPPTLLGSVESRWVPTVELTVHVRRAPAEGWMMGTFKTRFLMDGLLEEDGELWDSTGRPVALSRQLALVLSPR